jgi:hypothetical protein
MIFANDVPCKNVFIRSNLGDLHRGIPVALKGHSGGHFGKIYKVGSKMVDIRMIL